MPLCSEDDFLRLIDELFPNPPGPAGRGDDCAVLPASEELCVTTDLFLEHAHFRRSYFSPADIGHKGLAVNVSDVAAMGARPRAFTLDCIIPDGPDGANETFWRELFTGMADLAREYDLKLVGGDLSKGRDLGLSVTIWGTPGPGGRFLARGGCRPGDVLFVAGALGLARCGLYTLEEHGPASAENFPACVAAHLRPEPRVADGLALSALPGVRGLMDVSDGLARDLPRFLRASGAPVPGANVELREESLHPELVAWAAAREESPAEAAFQGGEDYALLGAADPAHWDAIRARLPHLAAVGAVDDRPGIRLNGAAYTREGFDHFGGKA